MTIKNSTSIESLEGFFLFAIYFLAVYEKLEGKWHFDYESRKKFHSSLGMAKMYCSKKANCFGIRVSSSGNFVYSIYFPIELRQPGDSDIHRKENKLGNFHLSIKV